MGKVLSKIFFCFPSRRPELDDESPSPGISYNNPTPTDAADSTHYRSYGATDNFDSKPKSSFAPASSDSDYLPPPPSSDEPPLQDPYHIDPNDQEDIDNLDVGTLRFPGHKSVLFGAGEFPPIPNDTEKDTNQNKPPPEEPVVLPPRPDSIMFAKIERPKTMLFNSLANLPPPEEGVGMDLQYSDDDGETPSFNTDVGSGEYIPEPTEFRLSTSSAPLPPPEDTETNVEADQNSPPPEPLENVTPTGDMVDIPQPEPEEKPAVEEPAVEDTPDTSSEPPLLFESGPTEPESDSIPTGADRPMSFLNIEPLSDNPEIHSFDTLNSRSSKSSLPGFRDSLFVHHPRANTLSVGGDGLNTSADDLTTSSGGSSDIHSGNGEKHQHLTDQPVPDSAFADIEESIFDTLSSLQSEDRERIEEGEATTQPDDETTTQPDPADGDVDQS